ncbi:MAG TPA: hypothetical protein VJ738_08860 [Steroidobacteraceae bacterium]|nr:hypothetical protein [Steroidobacteraceae bacterium]
MTAACIAGVAVISASGFSACANFSVGCHLVEEISIAGAAPEQLAAHPPLSILHDALMPFGFDGPWKISGQSSGPDRYFSSRDWTKHRVTIRYDMDSGRIWFGDLDQPAGFEPTEYDKSHPECVEK